MSLEIKELSERQRQVLRRLAGGTPPMQAATEAGYSAEHVSRLQRSELGRAELQRLRAEAELRLAEALPDLVTQSLQILQDQLSSPIVSHRVDAARFILRYLAKPALPGWESNTRIAKNGEHIIEIINYPKEGDNNESTTDI